MLLLFVYKMQISHRPICKALPAQIFAILMALKSSKCIKYTSNCSFNHASSFGGFLKEIHQKFKELWRSFTIEEWSGFRGGFMLLLFVYKMQISHRPICKALPAQIFAILMALKSSKCIKYTSNCSFNHASSFGGFLKEIHQEFTELWRSFTTMIGVDSEVDLIKMCYLFVEVYTKYLM